MVSKYQAVMSQISARIDQMEAGDRLPTEQDFVKEFAVSAMTVRRALQGLLDAKRITAVRGRGTFVAPSRVSRKMTLASFTESMLSAGIVPSAQLISASISRADDETAGALGLEGAQLVYQLQRLRLGNNAPYCVEYTTLPASSFPGLLGEDLTGSLYGLLQRKYGVVLERGESRISAVHPTPEQAELLDIPLEAPCLAVHTRTGNANSTSTPLEISVSIYRGDRYELVVNPEPAPETRQA